MTDEVRDIVCTWPKTRTLQSYLDELRKAEDEGTFIGFRVAHLPSKTCFGARCYMVHDGYVRGWTMIRSLAWSRYFTDPTTGKRMPKGYYIVRSPAWHEIEPIPMRGFQGWRYISW